MILYDFIPLKRQITVLIYAAVCETQIVRIKKQYNNERQTITDSMEFVLTL